MKTGYNELDKIVNLNKSQFIVCMSEGRTIENENFFINILKNISVDQKISSLYIDNNIITDCSKNIKKERKIFFENQKHNMEYLPMLMNVSDITHDDIISNIAMIDRAKLMNNRIIENTFTQNEIEKISNNNEIKLIDMLKGKKYNYICELFTVEEEKRIKKAEQILRNSPFFIKHTNKIDLDKFVKLCHEYKNKEKVNIIILNNLNTIEHSNDLEILRTLKKISIELNITVIMGYPLPKESTFSINEIKKRSNYIDTILFLKKINEFNAITLNIWIVKNIENTLGKIKLAYFDQYMKCANLSNVFDNPFNIF